MRELEAASDDAAVSKQPPDLLRRRARRHVEVLGTTSEVQVAHAAADQIGLMAGPEKLPHDLERVGVDLLDAQQPVRALVPVCHLSARL